MAERPRLLDAFCGAGGASVGYARAGFSVTGVDCVRQPRYPFHFVLGDALEYIAAHGRQYDCIHASPPCQRYCPVNVSGRKAGRAYPDLVGATREALASAGKPWVMENVPGAPLGVAALVCGSAFGMLVRRHRLFESSLLLFGTCCRHGEQARLGPRFPTCYRSRKDLREGGARRKSTVVQVYGHTAGTALWPAAMGVDWMNSRELSQAIPPAFTEFIGRQVRRYLEDAPGA